MLKKKFIFIGILIMAIASFFLLEADTSKGEYKPLLTKEDHRISTLERITENLHEKYDGVGVKTTSNNELVLQVVGDEEYFNSVKKDMESITKNVIKTTPLKDYRIEFERWDIVSGDINNIQKELDHLKETFMEEFKNYVMVKNVGVEYKKSITIYTAINSSDEDVHKLVTEIEDKVKKTLHSNKLNSVSQIDSYEIILLNTNGKAIN